jgi:hypothetical protein
MTMSSGATARSRLPLSFCDWAVASAQAGTVYVDPVFGKDSNPGTQALPFRNIGKALKNSRASTNTIHLAPGTYSIDGGERFAWSLFGHTSIIGPSDRSAVIDAAGEAGIALQLSDGSAEISGVTLRNFAAMVARASLFVENCRLEHVNLSLRTEAYLRAADVDVSGSSSWEAMNDSGITLKRVNVDGKGSGSQAFLRALNGSQLDAGELVIDRLVAGGCVIDVVESSLHLSNCVIADSWGKAGLDAGADTPVTVHVSGQDAAATLVETSIMGSAGIALRGEAGTVIKVQGASSFTGNQVGVCTRGASFLNDSVALRATAVFRNTLANWRVAGRDATASIRNADFRGGEYGVQSYDDARITVIDSSFRDVSRPVHYEPGPRAR